MVHLSHDLIIQKSALYILTWLDESQPYLPLRQVFKHRDGLINMFIKIRSEANIVMKFNDSHFFINGGTILKRGALEAEKQYFALVHQFLF